MNEEILKKCVEAGKIAAQVRREGAEKLSKVGASHVEVMDYCEKRILDLGGGIAWAQMGVNDVAAHACPTADDESVTEEGDLIKVDIGVHIDGWIADNAMTIEVNSDKYKDMRKASQNALRAAIKLIRPGVQLWELGEAQNSEAEAMGFKIIRNLCGHTLDQNKVHAGISIPTFNNKEKTELQEGWQVAIEPFVTDGQGLIKEKGQATVFMASGKGGRSPYARKVAEFVKPRNGLPFTTRELTRSLGKGPAMLGLRELQKTGGVRAYPPLAEVAGGMVAQFEHSMIVRDKPLIYTKHDEDEW
jgi:methionyl aminopeptidase